LRVTRPVVSKFPGQPYYYAGAGYLNNFYYDQTSGVVIAQTVPDDHHGPDTEWLAALIRIRAARLSLSNFQEAPDDMTFLDGTL
jgi:hypothetical protein